jgi:NADH-quinone oxidoreductase subunit G
VPRPRIFGSDELSALSPGIAELVEPGFIELRAADAQALGVIEGDGVTVDDALTTLEVRINDSMAAGCAGYSVGLAGALDLSPLQWITLRRAEGWQRRSPELIGSDRDTGPGGGHV